MKRQVLFDLTTCYLCSNPATTIMFVDGADWGGEAGYCGCRSVVPTPFGSALRAHRTDRHVSLRDLARRLEWSNGVVYISAIESGQQVPTQSEVVALANELGADVAEWSALVEDVTP